MDWIGDRSRLNIDVVLWLGHGSCGPILFLICLVWVLILVVFELTGFGGWCGGGDFGFVVGCGGYFGCCWWWVVVALVYGGYLSLSC